MLFLLKQTIAMRLNDLSRFYAVYGLCLLGLWRNVGQFLFSFFLFAVILSWQSSPVSAQTFDEASTNELNLICSGVLTPGMGEELIDICRRLVGGGADGGLGNASSGVGTLSQPNSILISQQQLKDLQTKKERENRHNGGSADSVAENWGRFSTFLTTGATTLRHRENEFEQGYSATIPSVTVGGGYLVSDTFETGIAFNYSNSNASNTTGGGFNVDSYSPLLYFNYLPLDNGFTSLVLGYTRQNQSNERLAVAGVDGSTGLTISGLTKGNLNSNQYTLNFLGGYDHPIESFTVGPRVGIDVRQWEMDSYQESTNTGLELRYNSQHQTSIQSTLGLLISYAHSFYSGVLVPQLSASWVHEYSNNSRTIHAQFIQAPASNGFDFQTENPERNWATIDLGLSFVMKNGVQAFVNFSTVQGNRNFESYGGNVGVRVGW